VPGSDNNNGGELGRRARLGIPPLNAAWEELVDDETKHKFFANHATRQTSWADPRATLRCIQLVKGPTGLGLGLAGAKRLWDDSLALGIFVSSRVPGSAADAATALRDGDEILEVNNHSLIGVSREGCERGGWSFFLSFFLSFFH
jgi:hypothetical protein